MLHYKIVA